MRMSMRMLLCGSAAISGLAMAGGAWAQSDEASHLDDVIVTAQKRSQSVQSIPGAITALGSEALQERGVSQVSDLQFMVPSLQTGKLLGQTAVTIRGVGLNQGSPGVAIHVDGVYQSRPAMGDLAQVDLERVEVLRGPQGTLYGRNANGGVINFITKAPTDQFEGYVLGSYGNYDESRLQSVINVPFSDRIRARLVLDRWNREEGFVKNVIPGGQDLDKGTSLAGRLRVSADLAENLKLDLSASALHSTGPSLYFTLHNKPSPTAIAQNPFLQGANIPLEPWRTSANDPVTSNRNFGSGSATLTWDIGGATVRSITGYSRLADLHHGDDDTFNLTAFPVVRQSRSKSLTQEINVSRDIGPVSLVGGLFYLADDAYVMQNYDFKLGIFPLPPGSVLHFETLSDKSKTYAAFADATWNITDRLRLLGGLRFSKDSEESTQRNYLQLNIPNVPLPPTFTCPLQTNKVDWSSTTPRIGVQYDLNDSANVYGTVSRGFKVGGFNPFACNNVFEPEKLTSYEAGIKTRLFDRTLTLNASAFYYDYTNLQLNQTVGLAILIKNAPAAEIKGLEVEATWQPDEHWTINGNVSLLDATYTEFSNIDSLSPELGLQDVSGNYLNDAPKRSINGGIAYRSDPFSFGRLTARADVSYRSSFYFREFNNPLDGQDAYTLTNLALIWDSPDDKYRVRLYGTNVTNEARIIRMSSSDQLGARFVTWGAPRQFGVELKANF
jgi:iron complex outermembrane receptor protein